MAFALPTYVPPDFGAGPLADAPPCRAARVERAGVAPKGYHATSVFPEYLRLSGTWVLLEQSRMDCVVVLSDGGRAPGGVAIPVVTEFRHLQLGDLVVLGRDEDGSDGIYVHTKGFPGGLGLGDMGLGDPTETFAFRTGRSRETSYSRDYDSLYDLLRHERDHGYVVWVLGPAVVFDSDARGAMAALIRAGFVHAIMAGNALATHDLEAAYLGTALGQDIYTQRRQPLGHYHHLDTINEARAAGSVEALVAASAPADGIVHACTECGVPLVLAGSIRDDGPLPGVHADVYAAQDAMRFHTRRATTVLCLASQLHSIATGNMTPSYQAAEGVVRPVYIYSVDISEFVVNKLRDRGTLGVISLVTNVQDFLVHISRNLVG